MRDEEIAVTWIENCVAAIDCGVDSKEADRTFWAYSELDRLCSDDPNRALDIVQLIASKRPADRVLCNLAAGPLEDLLVRHGATLIDRIEKLAQAESPLSIVIPGVWTERIDPTLQARVRALIERVESLSSSPPIGTLKH